MHRSWRVVGPLLPAIWLMLFAIELGNFHRGVGALQTIARHGLLFGVLAAALPVVDRRVLLPLACIWGAASASLIFSPIPRAGLTFVPMLPAFLVLPWAVAWLWRDSGALQLGLRGVLWALTGVAGWALFSWQLMETPGASLPLGHHNLLATWLVTLLPLATLVSRVGRWTAASAAVVGLVALLATSSLTGLLAFLSAGLFGLAVAARTGAWRQSRGGIFGFRVAAALLLLVVAVWAIVGTGRLADLGAGRDPSVTARLTYMQAAWRGALERPLTGWGAGALRWTFGESLRPIPGVHPPGQVVADAHNLPLQALYELGFPACFALVGAGLVVWRRSRRRHGGEENRDLDRAAAAGLLAFFVASLGGLDLSVTALPVAAVVVFGARLAAHGPWQGFDSRSAFFAAASLAVGLLLWQIPRDLAQFHYDRAVQAEESAEQLLRLRRAVELDPGQPLYGWRLAIQESGQPVDTPVSGRLLATSAAESARGLSALWLSAGDAQASRGELLDARQSYIKACDLDPLGALAAFRLATLPASAFDGDEAVAVEHAVRALLAEPNLLAATGWPSSRLAGAIESLLDLDGVDPGWREAVAETFLVLAEESAPDPTTVDLGLRVDAVAGESMSLFAFRRRPWPAVVGRIELRRAALEKIDLPPASTLALTDPAVFAPGCRLPMEPAP